MALPDTRTWNTLDRLLTQVLALPSEQRAAFLANVGATDASSVEQLRRLLERADNPDGIDDINSSPLFLEALSHLHGLGPGDRLGDWLLGRRLAYGGMSEVFTAERMRGGVCQRAALKLLAVGYDDGSLQQRFARECRILAVLSDARIARYYDSGIAPDGRPWLAMEQVDGLTLDHYVSVHQLGLSERLRLFLELAGAVAHAHRHLVVHRDLKPANVLVADNGQLKLIDFGIAKALGEDASAAATAVETRLLTLNYASPEQLQGGTVNTASDIYQLGLLLYELISDRRPFDDCGDDRLQLIKAVLERDPEPPSRRLRRAGERERSARVRGDLDAIVLKALLKQPADRYSSVDALSADLVAWLDDRPVQARVSGYAERARKFLRRHRLATAASLLAIVLGVALGSAWLSQMLRASHAAQTAQAVLRLLEQTLHADAYGAQPQPPETVTALLDQTEQRAHITLAGQPEVLARTLLLVGQARLGRGEYRKAVVVLERAQTIANAASADDTLLADILDPLITSLHYSGDYANALRWSQQRVDRADTSPARIYALLPHADLLHSLGDYESAEQVARRALTLSRQTYGDDHGSSLQARQYLGMVLRDRGQFAEAQAHLDDAVRIERSKGGSLRVGLAVSLGHLGQVHLQQGDLAAATAALDETKAIRDHLFLPGNLSRSWSDHWLALLALAQGGTEAAVAQLTTMVAIYDRHLNQGSHITALARSDLGWALLAAGQSATAAVQFDVADAVLAAVAAGRHPRRADLMLGRAVIALRGGDRQQARSLAEAALQLRRRGTGDGHPMLAAICRVLRQAGGQCAMNAPTATALAWRQLDLALAPAAP